jgi:murein DD-endopeptidase MepM/ murein hydrolase activator NlpD
MLVASLMLGGLLPMDARTREHWAPSGAFRMPVGDPYQVYENRPRTPGPFFIVRGVAWEGERASHQGADLGSGSAGALVRAAGSGVVVSVQDHGQHGGYGTHVVLAHRLPEGELAYTVYAHLREYSPRVKAGQCVQAGQVLGRVGETGHATGPHLHFEVRVARDPDERWEFARVEDPLAFVDARLPTYRADTTGNEACLEWAECAGLVAPGTRGEDLLTHEAWWRMIAAAVRGPALDPSLPPPDLRDSLVAARMVWEGADHSGGSPGQGIEWSELAHDFGRARALGVRTGPGPLRRSFHREACEDVLGTPAPAAHVSALVARAGRPCIREAVMLFADLAGPAPEPAKPATKKPAAPIGAPVAAATGRGPTSTRTIASAGADSAHGTHTHARALAHGDSLGGKPRATKPKAGATATAARTVRAPADSLHGASSRTTAHRDTLGGKAGKAARKPAGATAAAKAAPADSLHPRPPSRSVARRDTVRAAPPPASPATTLADTTS